jgi:hypothetical protein
MVVSKRCRRIRFARATVRFVGAGLALMACAGGWAHAAGVAPGEHSGPSAVTAYSTEFASAAAAVKHSGAAESLPELSSAPPHRNVERTISEALAPPRWRCAELRAAINQAAMDARGSQSMDAAPQFGRSPHAGPTRLPPASVGAIDKRSRLEAEYSQLKCARQAP